MLKLAFILIICLPIVFYYGGVIVNGTTPFLGGLSLQSFVYSVWEQILGVSVIIGLIGLFKEKCNMHNGILKIASANSYAVYLIHPLVLVVLSLLMANIKINNGLKFLILAPISLIFCFFTAKNLRKLPYLKRIL